MNKAITLIILLMALPVVLAGNEFGKVTSGGDLIITDFDVKVDGRTSRNVEYGEEISREAYPSSQLEFDVEYKNNNSNTDMEDLEFILYIEDLDIEESDVLDNLNKGSDRTITFDITLPSDAEDGDYEVLIEAEGELNNTIHRVEYYVDLVVEYPEDGETGTPIEQSIQSLTNNISEISKEIGDYFTPYTECKSERDSLVEQIKSKDTEITNLQEFKGRYDQCNNQLTGCNEQKAEWEIKYNAVYINLTEVCQPQIEGTRNNYTLYGIIILLAIAIFMYFRKKERNPQSEAEQSNDVS